jgi:beta-1,4-mannosyltransferase
VQARALPKRPDRALAVVRVACWPATDKHDYLRSLYCALRAHAIEVSVDGVPFESRFLSTNRDSFDILHLHWPEHLWGGHDQGWISKARGLVGFWRYLRTARRLGLPVVWTAHNLKPHHGASFVDALGYRLAEWLSDLVICHDRHTLETLESRLRPRSTTLMQCKLGNLELVWPRPQNPDEQRRRHQVGAGERFLVCCGGMLDYKGFDVAAQAMRHLDGRYKLVIAGDAPNQNYLSEVREQAAGLQNVTIVPGWMAAQDMVDLLAAADCVLLPYRVVTGSAVLLAAATVGKAVVASDLPFFREALAAEPLAGVLCQPDSDRALAAGVEQFFATDIAERHEAAKRLSDLHSWKSIVPPVADWMRRAVRV